MRRYGLALLIALCVAGLGSLGFALAQDEEKSRFVRFVERQLSTPDRQISLGEIDGALSSDVRIASITVADREGVWLTIEEAHLVWSRLALLRGRLDVDLLEAGSITVARPPLPPEEEETIEEAFEDAPFALPDLPVEIVIDRLAVPQVNLGEGIIGTAASLAVDGSVSLDDGALDSSLEIERLDRPGELSLAASFDSDSRELAIDLTLDEPADGVIANALSVEGRPPLELGLKGEGPLSDFEAALSLTASGETLVEGSSRIERIAEGLNFVARIEGELEPLVAPLYDPFVAGGSQLVVDLVRADDGAITVREGRLESGVAEVAFAAEIGADGVPTELSFDASLERGDGEPIVLPGAGPSATVRAARITGRLPGGEDTRFSAEANLTGLDTPVIATPSATIRAEGTATALGDPEARAVTFAVEGRADELASDNPGVADALGNDLALSASGRWDAGSAVEVADARLVTDTVEASFSGTVGEALRGTYALNASDLGAFAELAGRELDGAVRAEVDGSVGFSGLLDITVDAVVSNFSFDGPAGGLFEGDTAIAGRLARGEESVAFDDFSLSNDQLTLTVDGEVSDAAADLQANVGIADLAALNEEFSGGLDARLTVSGVPAAPNVTATVTAPRLTLSERTLSDLEAAFDGTLDRGSEVPFDLDGTLSAEASVDGAPLGLTAGLESAEGGRTLRSLDAEALGATASGTLTYRDDGLLAGDLSVDVPDLASLAELALLEASGQLSADVSLAARDDAQLATVSARARDVALGETLSLGSANIDLSVDDVFGVPLLDGRAEVLSVRAAGYDVRSLTLRAEAEGSTSAISLNADLGTATLAASGGLARGEDDGFVARLDAFELARPGLAARLIQPTEVSVSGEAIAIAATELAVGEGDLSLEGTVADTLDLEARLNAIPLDIANLIRPDLQADGTLSGALSLSGTRQAPQVTARLDARGLTAAPLRDLGIEPLTVDAEGAFAEGTLTLERLATEVGGGRVTASGTVGETLDLDVSVDALPLALANAVRPELEVSGTVSGAATVSGTREAPVADFRASLEAASAAPLRSAGIDPLDAVVEGRFADGTATIERLRADLAGGVVTASGRVGEVLDLTAEATGVPLALVDAVQPELGLRGTLQATVRATGSLSEPDVAFEAEIPELTAAATRAANLPPAAVRAAGRFDGEAVALSEAVVEIGEGRAVAEGTVGQRLDLEVRLDALPLALANAARPGLGVAGALSGTVQVEGTLRRPEVTFELNAPEISTEALRRAGLPPASARTAGSFADGTARIDEALIRAAGGEASANGTVGRELDLTVDVATLPLSLASAVRPELGLSGRLSGQVRATGSLSRPVASFDAQVTSLSAAPLERAGVGPLDVAGAGRLEDNVVRLESLRADGPAVSLTASGVAPLSGGGLDITVNASAPLSLANIALANRGATIDGQVAANVRVTGSLTDPNFAGEIDGRSITFIDPRTNLRLSEGSLAARLEGNRVVISSLSARLGEGSVAVAGTIGIGGGFPADLTVVLRNARYSDGRLIAVTLDGDLTVSGQLTGSPLVAGTILVDRAEITIPQALAGAGTLIDVTHVNIPPDVRATLRRAEAGPFARRPDEGRRAEGLRLDVTIDAPARVFVRGRGIDAELGGSLRVTGPLSAIRPVGEFELIRGRLVILGQRIVFTEGSLTLFGDLNPTVRLVAETRGDDVTVRVIVEGPVREPTITFQSSPDLPQDEVLAQLLFNRSISELSPFQIAQLAVAVAELAGAGGGPSIFEQVRVFSGLDNFEIYTDAEGNTAAQAGRYIADNIYLGVRAGESSGVTLNLDITRNLTVRAEALTNESSVGVYYELEY